jgi:uncharacterized protein YacL
MDILAICIAALWVDFVIIALSKVFDFGETLKKWYREFGAVAVINDTLVIVLGILIAEFMFPKASLPFLVVAVIAIQVVHDVLLNVLVIQKVPRGSNRIIDIFKEYVQENSYKILIADAIMISSAIAFSRYLHALPRNVMAFIGLLGVYSMTYMIHQN